MSKRFLFVGIAHVLSGAKFDEASFLLICAGGIFPKNCGEFRIYVCVQCPFFYIRDLVFD